MNAPSTTTTTLVALANEINAEHFKAERAINDALEHARRCGELLVAAKEQCPHGAWGSWLRDNFHASQQTAAGYMRIASRWSDIEQIESALSIRDALNALAEPRESASTLPDAPANTPPIPPVGHGLVGIHGDVRVAIEESAEHPGFYDVTSWTVGDGDTAQVTTTKRPAPFGVVARVIAATVPSFRIADAEWETVSSRGGRLSFGKSVMMEDAESKLELVRLTSRIKEKLATPEAQVWLAAVAEIRDSRLYRGTHDTFESYMSGRWGMDMQLIEPLLPAPAA